MAVIFVVQLCGFLPVQESGSRNKHKHHNEGHPQNTAGHGADSTAQSQHSALKILIEILTSEDIPILKIQPLSSRAHKVASLPPALQLSQSMTVPF